MDASEFKTDYHFTREDSVEVDTFLGFRGEYETVKLLMKLRFKILNYFMMWLRDPSVSTTPQAEALLKCVNEVLIMEHQRCAYQPVMDLPSKKEVRPRPPIDTLNYSLSIPPNMVMNPQNYMKPIERPRREDKPIYRPPHLKKNEYTEDRNNQNGNQYPEDFSAAFYQEDDEADQPFNGTNHWSHPQSPSAIAATKNIKDLLKMSIEDSTSENGQNYQNDQSFIASLASGSGVNLNTRPNINGFSSFGAHKKWAESYSNDVRQSGLDAQRSNPRYDGANVKPKQNGFNQRNRNYNNGSYPSRSNGRQNDNSWDTRAACRLY